MPDGSGPLFAVRHDDHLDVGSFCPRKVVTAVVTECTGDAHVLVGQKLGCKCGAVVKRR